MKKEKRGRELSSLLPSEFLARYSAFYSFRGRSGRSPTAVRIGLGKRPVCWRAVRSADDRRQTECRLQNKECRMKKENTLARDSVTSAF